MLIIFDLDDTLIDTSGALTPLKLQKVLEGFHSLTIDQLSDFNDRLGAKGAIAHIMKQASSALSSPLPDHFQVPCTPFAKEILEEYAARYRIALVTAGYPPFQLEKLKKAGIEASLFSKILIPEDSIKKPHYQGLLEEFSVSPAEVWVCGDKIDVDLMPAHELGCKTIHMQWGRGKKVVAPQWVDYTIGGLEQLRDIIQ